MAQSSINLPSAAFFNPQSKAAGPDYLDTLHAYLHNHGGLGHFVEAIRSIPKTWEAFDKHRFDTTASAGTRDQKPTEEPLVKKTRTTRATTAEASQLPIITVPAATELQKTTQQYTDKKARNVLALSQISTSVKQLVEWIETGGSLAITNAMSGCLTLPLLTIIQICQYFQYLQLQELKHSDFLKSLRHGGGLHGYCGGLLPAAAIAVSADEAELVLNAAKALHLAFIIGAYGDLGDDDPLGGPTNMVIRLKNAEQGEAMIQKYPGAYISAVTDPKTISIVGPSSVLQRIRAWAKDEGLHSQGVHIRGKVHNPENNNLIADVNQFCVAHGLGLPDCTYLKAPFRSNTNGHLLVQGSLTGVVIKTILADKCDWYSLVANVAKDLSHTHLESHRLVNFGIGDCLSPVPFHDQKLKITKLDAMSLTKNVKASASTVNDQAAPYDYPANAVAVIGMACRYPGANNVEELWDLVSSGRSMVQELPQTRVDAQRNLRLQQDNSSRRKKFYGNFLDRPDLFDHAFFGITAREATNMDPQQRLLLETSYHALESSGYLAEHKRDEGENVGVFIGASFVEYLANTSSHPPTAYTSVGTLNAFLCGRISHFFGWTGPAEVVDTACSSSLVAINRACKALQNGECSMALAGGVNVISSIDNFLDLGKAGFLSPTGQCKPFDKGADGYCRAEGVGLVFLKPLDHALRHNDNILGVIGGVATNQSGLSPSLTVPHSPAQVHLYRQVLDQAALDPALVSYVEAHGTGTQVGDPLELASIRQVFGDPKRSDTLHIGSVKGNIGHCETAAGVAGFIKAILLLQKGVTPPQASHGTLNPKIPDLHQDRMAIALQKKDWNTSFRAVCVNSYGAAGSNAAVLLCQPPPPPPAPVFLPGSSWPILLSAASEETLRSHMEDLRSFLLSQGSRHKATALMGSTQYAADVAFTLAEKRQHQRFRWATIIRTVADLSQVLQIGGSQAILEIPKVPRKAVLVFPGQVGQTISMNHELYEQCDLFRSHLDQCDTITRQLDCPSIYPSIFQPAPIQDLKVLHCCLFAQQYASARCWIDSGLHVDAVIGHSFGELTAMAVAGILSLKDALTLVVERASLVESHWGPDCGSMLSIRCSVETADEIVKFSGRRVEIACYNANESLVLGGTQDAVQATARSLRSEPRFSGFKHQQLAVSHAYHTSLSASILDDLGKVAHRLRFESPNIHVEACTPEAQGSISAEHIVRHMRNPVYFHRAIRRLEDRFGECVWLEAGLGSPTFSLVKRAVARPAQHLIQPVNVGVAQDPTDQLSEITAAMWRQGVDVSNWNFHANSKLQTVWLPPYHFQGTSHWLPFVNHAAAAPQGRPPGSDNKEKAQEPRLVERLALSGENKDSCTYRINTGTRRFLDIVTGHAVLSRPLCPASLYFECAYMAVQQEHSMETHNVAFEDCSFESPLGTAIDREVRVNLQNRQDAWSFGIVSCRKNQMRGPWLTHAKGTIHLRTDPQIRQHERLVSRQLQKVRSVSELESLRRDKAYRLFSRVVNYSDALQGITTMTFADTEAIAEVDIPSQVSKMETAVSDLCDTVSLDVFIQVCGLLVNCHGMCPADSAYLAVGAECIRMSQHCNFDHCTKWTVYAMFKPDTGGKATGDVYVVRPGGDLVMAMTGLQFARVPLKTLGKLLDGSSDEPSHRLPDNKTVKTMSETLPSSRHQANYTESSIKMPSEQTMGHLRDLIACHIGIASDGITDNTSFGAMGIDSLAALELADDLSSKFNIQVPGANLLQYDLKALCRHMKTDERARIARQTMTSSEAATSSQRQSNLSSMKQGPALERRSKLAEIVSQLSGSPTTVVVDGATFDDLGIDSLARIDLKSEIEKTFARDIDASQFNSSTNFQDILDVIDLNIDGSTEPTTEGLSPASSTSFPMADTPDLHEACWVPTPMKPKPASIDASRQSSLVVDPTQVLAKCDTNFGALADKNGFTYYWSCVASRQDQLMIEYILQAFLHVNINVWDMKAHEEIPILDHQPKHDKLVQRLYDILERHEIIYVVNGRRHRSAKQIMKWGSFNLEEAFAKTCEKYTVDLSLVKLTGPWLSDCLSGASDPLKLLFGSQRSQQILNDFYHKSPMFVTMTDLLLNFIREIMEAHTQSKNGNIVHILEVGAGFGGTTTYLAKMLQENGWNVRYTFTDIAPSLVDKARQKFSSTYTWMDFTTLDLEKDVSPTLQGQYDIVIATNVVHATTNLVASTRRIKSLLKEGGFVCLSEITKVIEWHNLVFGLLSGWWCFNDGRTYALQSAGQWMEVFKKAGFETCSYSTGPSEEARSQQLLVGSTKALAIPDAPGLAVASPDSSRGPGASNIAIPGEPSLNRIHPGSHSISRSGDHQLSTVVYKVVDEVEVHADIYFPKIPKPNHAMPIALLIHGGGFMTLSRKIVPPAQIRYLLANGILPVSLDHRLCPEINIIDGPIADIRDAVGWARTTLPDIASGSHAIRVDSEKLAVIGWSTGGHLAMTTAWTTVEAGIAPPKAILNFYGPSDMEALATNKDLGKQYPGRTMSLEQIRSSMSPKPITSYLPSPSSSSSHNTTSTNPKFDSPFWYAPHDARSELVLSLFKEPSSRPLNLLLNGLPNDPPDLELPVRAAKLDAINPFTQVRQEKYAVPTFSIHGEKDDIVPASMSVAFDQALRGKGVDSGCLMVVGESHLLDTGIEPGSEAWERNVQVGYDFLFKHLGIEQR
ncbi:MAG: hypothetical protein Q9218_002089 [Villophora microphyllina]